MTKFGIALGLALAFVFTAACGGPLDKEAPQVWFLQKKGKGPKVVCCDPVAAAAIGLQCIDPCDPPVYCVDETSGAVVPCPEE